MEPQITRNSTDEYRAKTFGHFASGFRLVPWPNQDVYVKRADGKLCAIVLDDFDRQQVRPIEEC